MSQLSSNAVDLVEVIRGETVESIHRGHAVICDGAGQVIDAWGDPSAMIYPRSSCKMVQALPLLESGAGRSLSTAQLALACASHQGAVLHSEAVAHWLADMGLSEGDLRCGSHMPYSDEARDALVRAGEQPCQLHNNCSGKHAGFLMLSKHLGAGPEYVEVDHPVQQAVRTAFEDMMEMDSPGYGIDGCSAPNFLTRLDAFAGAMGRFARAREGQGTRQDAMARLTHAMGAAPDMVAGDGRACTELMQAMNGRGAVKTGAEGVFVAILPELDRGIALKIVDGTTRASEAVIAALLVHVGALDAADPAVHRLTVGPIRNRRDINTGHYNVTLSAA